VACRWPDGFRCPGCGDGGSYPLVTRDLLQCRACRRQASVTAGTVLDRTRLPLPLWCAAAYLVGTHTPGFSALQLQRQLGLARYETAWTMLQKLRRAMVRPERDRLSGTVELDETYIGGVEEGRRGGRRRASKKSILAGAVEVRGHGSGRIRLAVVPNLSATTFARFAAEAITPGSTVLTDGWHSFRALSECYEHRPTVIGDPKNAAKHLPRSIGPSPTSRPGCWAPITASAPSICPTTSTSSSSASTAADRRWRRSSPCSASMLYAAEPSG
jgi:ISXO2-like transposase domain/Transposase zinc-ribbon domain